MPVDDPTPAFEISSNTNEVCCGDLEQPITLTIANLSKNSAGSTEICLTLPAGMTLTADDITVVAPMGYAPMTPDPPTAVGTGGVTQLCFDGPTDIEVGSFLCLEIMPDVSTLDCGEAEIGLTVTSSLGSCSGQEFVISISQLEELAFDDVVVELCETGCQTVDLGIPALLQDDLEILITPSLFLTDDSSFEPEICDPANDLNYLVSYTLNGQCMTTSAINMTVVAPPTVVLTAMTGCQTGFSLGDLITVSPVDLDGDISSNGTGAFSPGTRISDNPTYTPSAADIEAGEVQITVRTDNPDGPCAGVVARETFTILLVDCGTFFWDGSND